MAVNAKAGGWALVIGSLAFVGLMVVHPSHAGEPQFGPLTLNDVVHGTALVMQPVLLFGFWRLTRSMGDRALPQLALCFYALAAATTIIAATLSGIVIPAIMQAGHTHGASMPGPAPGDLETLQQQLQAQAIYTVWLNRSFAGVQVGEFALATLLWSIAWPNRSGLAIVTRLVGVLSGLGVIAWALSGTMTLEAQEGALLATVVQMFWTLLAASVLLSSRSAES